VQLARGERRYRRKVASPKQWQAIIQTKQGPCRVCEAETGTTKRPAYGGTYHHLVSREDHGDDIADNIVPLCWNHHDDVTRRFPSACSALLATLAPAERAYMAARGGPDYAERAYGVEYQR